MSRPVSGLLLISIDCLPDGSRTSHASRRIHATAASLVKLFGECELPASWAIADPAGEPLTRAILDQPVPHRVGLLAEPHWANETRGWTPYARELTRRLDSAAVAGIAINALALRGGAATPHLELLVRHRVGVIRDVPTRARGSSESLQVCSGRFGIWRACPTHRVPTRDGWWSVLRPALPQRIARRADQGKVTHLLIDVPASAQRKRNRWSHLRKILGQLQRHVEAERLVCVTLERLVEHLKADPVQRSRSAAARRAA